MAALLDEAKKAGLGSTAHLQQGGVAQMNAIKAARLGLNTVTHFYGHFESLLKDYVVQPWPVDMNAGDEQWRFAQVARLVEQDLRARQSRNGKRISPSTSSSARCSIRRSPSTPLAVT